MVFFCALLGLCLAFFAFIASFMQIISKGAYELRVVRYNACRRLARRGFSVHLRGIGAVLVQLLYKHKAKASQRYRNVSIGGWAYA